MFMCESEACNFKISSLKLMKMHNIQEHGLNCTDNYTETGFESKSNIKRGQTKCASCGLNFNNRARPVFCNCGHKLKEIKEKKLLNAFKLNGPIFSVRKNRSGISK